MEQIEQIEKDKQALKEYRTTVKFLTDKKNWEENVVKKIDLVTPDISNIDKYSVQPGFEFYMSLVTAG